MAHWLFLALAAPLECARLLAEGGRLAAETSAPGLTEGCAYPDSTGVKVNDMVRIYKPESAMHNVMSFVGCPEGAEGGAGFVCLADSKGCFPPEDLRPVSDVDVALVNLHSRVKDFAGAVSEKAGEHWPMVQEKLAVFAHITRERMGVVGGHFMTAVNYTFCEPHVRKQVKATFATIQSIIVAIADSSVKRWPTIRPKLASIAKVTAESSQAIGRELANVTNEAVSALYEDVSASVSNITSSYLDEHPKIAPVLEGTGTFISAVGGLTQELALIAVDTYNHENVQEALAGMQAGAGQLIADGAKKWPAVRRALGKAVNAGAQQVEELGLQAVETVNACNPEKRGEVQAAFASVEARVRDMASASTEHWPAVESGVSDLVESMSAKVDLLSRKVKDALQRKEVQDAIAVMREHVTELQGLTAQDEKSKLRQAVAQAKARALARNIEQKVRLLFQTFTKGESTAVIDHDDIAELMPVANVGAFDAPREVTEHDVFFHMP